MTKNNYISLISQIWYQAAAEELESFIIKHLFKDYSALECSVKLEVAKLPLKKKRKKKELKKPLKHREKELPRSRPHHWKKERPGPPCAEQSWEDEWDSFLVLSVSAGQFLGQASMWLKGEK